MLLLKCNSKAVWFHRCRYLTEVQPTAIPIKTTNQIYVREELFQAFTRLRAQKGFGVCFYIKNQRGPYVDC